MPGQLFHVMIEDADYRQHQWVVYQGENCRMTLYFRDHGYAFDFSFSDYDISHNAILIPRKS
jgi:hypothetical protein